METLLPLCDLEIQYGLSLSKQLPTEHTLIGCKIRVYEVPLKDGVPYREHPYFGLCVYSSRSIYILEGSSINTIYHELFHMYLDLIGCRHNFSFTEEEPFVEFSGCAFQHIHKVALEIASAMLPLEGSRYNK